VIHVFIGTKAQYVKMAPLLARMDSAGVDYRLIDSGQHAALAASFRAELGVRDPDLMLGRGRDVDSVPRALSWALGLAVLCGSRKKLRREVFGGSAGVCVVHGDTPTTLLSALLARRAGLAVAHVEAGLRTHRWLHPFPEEIVRVLVGRLADVLFAPSAAAADNLRRSGVKGRVVEQSENTVAESVTEALGADFGRASFARSEQMPQAGAPAPVIVTMHRVENLHRRWRREAMIDLVEKLARAMPVRWLMHAPTERAVSGGARSRLAAAGAELAPLVSHGDFLEMISAAPFVITDGGSIQEECALLGVPTLLWRDRTDRSDGVGVNVVLSRYDSAVVESFLDDPQRFRSAGRVAALSPSEEILAELEAWR